jgi:hypothetical protein
LIRCSGAHFDPFVVKAFTEIPIDSWREIRELSSEPGFTMRSTTTGKNLRYSVPTIADRSMESWER